MAPSTIETDDGNNAVSSDSLTEETTATGILTSPAASSSSDTTQLPTLPFEIVVEILSKLPVKFLMQFQSVCKSWKSLISDPKFAKKHLRVSTTRHHLLLTFPSHSPEIVLTTYPLSPVITEMTAMATQLEFPLNSPNNRSYYAQLVDSCHGILCFELDQRFILLWNPSIRKFTKLPSLDNPKESYPMYGFGYTRFIDSYKVVAISSYFESDGSYKTQANVLTLGTNVWRRIRDFPTRPFDVSGKFVRGNVNWLAYRDSCSSLVIASLDLEKESYQEFLQPDYGGVTVDTLSLGVLRDCLCLLFQSDTFSDVWLMMEYGNKDSWTKLFRLPYVGDLGSCPKALYVSEDDKVLLECQSGLVVHNARDATFKILEIQNIYGWMNPEIYQESLISPCS